MEPKLQIKQGAISQTHVLNSMIQFAGLQHGQRARVITAGLRVDAAGVLYFCEMDHLQVIAKEGEGDDMPINPEVQILHLPMGILKPGYYNMVTTVRLNGATVLERPVFEPMPA